MIDMHTNLFLPQHVFNSNILSLKTMYSFMCANKKTVMFNYHNCFIISRPGGNRTLDPMIKSHVLCQLSYGPDLAAN